jgi:hypothetical protein
MRATFAASTGQKILQTKRNADLGIFVLLFLFIYRMARSISKINIHMKGQKRHYLKFDAF